MIRRPQDDHRYAQVSASDDDASSDDNRGPAHLDGQKAPGPATRFVIAPRSAPLRWALAAVADRRNGTSTLCVRVGLAALLLPSVAFLILAAATIARGGAGALLAGLAEPRPVGQSLPPSLPVPADGGSADAVALPLSNPPPQSLLDERAERFAEVKNLTCRFPSFISEDETHYSLGRGTHWMEWTPDRRKGHWKHKMQYAKNKHGNMTSRKKYYRERGERSITFIHVGKAGGTSLICHIRGAIKWGVNCPGYNDTLETIPDFPGNESESAISTQVSCYTHYDYRLNCLDNPTLAINIRNPIRRIASWFYYEHLENSAARWGFRSVTCGQQMVYKCYRHINELAEHGLAGPRLPPTTMLHVTTDPTEEECRHWAWAAVQGTAPASFHNVWNYDWYARAALDPVGYGLEDPKNKEILAFRAEHVDQDWTTIDRMLGGTGEVPRQMHLNSDHDNMLYNTTISAKGYLNLCRAMCEEVQMYKRLLFRAANLDDDDVLTSIKELNCPDDMTLTIRECPERGDFV